MMKEYTLFLNVVMICIMPALGQPLSFIPNILDQSFMEPGGIYMSDINGDGFNDVVAASTESNAIAWWQSDGAYPIAWEKQLVDDDFDGAIYVNANDIDGDGLTDIAGAAYYAHELAWWRNEGGQPTDWTKYVVASGFTKAHEVMAFDLDMDGDLDVLGVSAGLHRISWFENDGGFPIVWTEHIIGSNFAGARSVDAADIDGDGDMDIAGAALADGEISWWRNEGGQPFQWTKIIVSDTFTQAHKVQLVDLDLDSHLDILGTSYNRGISWFRNDGGEGTDWTEQVVSSLNSAVIAYAVDLDQDGDLDVAGTAQGGGIIGRWENLGVNSLEFHFKRIEFFGGAWPLHYGDLDGDGDVDLVCGGNSANAIKWYENELVTGTESSEIHKLNLGITAFPNPFIQSLQIRFGLEVGQEIQLRILDSASNELSLLVNGYLAKGNHQFEWSGLDQTGREVPAAIYFCELRSESQQQMIKIIKSIP